MYLIGFIVKLVSRNSVLSTFLQTVLDNVGYN